MNRSSNTVPSSVTRAKLQDHDQRNKASADAQLDSNRIKFLFETKLPAAFASCADKMPRTKSFGRKNKQIKAGGAEMNKSGLFACEIEILVGRRNTAELFKVATTQDDARNLKVFFEPKVNS